MTFLQFYILKKYNIVIAFLAFNIGVTPFLPESRYLHQFFEKTTTFALRWFRVLNDVLAQERSSTTL